MHASIHCIGTIPSHNDLVNKIFNGVDRMSARLDKKNTDANHLDQ